MKRLLIVVMVMMFTAAAIPGVAEEKHKESKGKEEKVYCCHGKGDCDKLHTKADCEKDGGTVVKDCKQCK